MMLSDLSAAATPHCAVLRSTTLQDNTRTIMIFCRLDFVFLRDWLIADRLIAGSLITGSLIATAPNIIVLLTVFGALKSVQIILLRIVVFVSTLLLRVLIIVL